MKTFPSNVLLGSTDVERPNVQTGKVKGTAVMKPVKALRSKVNQARKVLPKHLHTYLEDTIVPFGWYDEEDFIGLVRGFGRLPSHSEGLSWESVGKDAARVDLEGVYRTYVRKGRPEATLSKLSDFWSVLHDTGEVTVQMAGSEAAQIELADYVLSAEEICDGFTGLISESLRLSGATGIHVIRARCRAEGDERCLWRACWQNPIP